MADLCSAEFGEYEAVAGPVCQTYRAQQSAYLVWQAILIFGDI